MKEVAITEFLYPREETSSMQFLNSLLLWQLGAEKAMWISQLYSMSTLRKKKHK